jgi:hypothetical protein
METAQKKKSTSENTLQKCSIIIADEMIKAIEKYLL